MCMYVFEVCVCVSVCVCMCEHNMARVHVCEETKVHSSM